MDASSIGYASASYDVNIACLSGVSHGMWTADKVQNLLPGGVSCSLSCLVVFIPLISQKVFRKSESYQMICEQGITGFCL